MPMVHYHYGDMKWHMQQGELAVPRVGEFIRFDINHESGEALTLAVKVVDWRLKLGPEEAPTMLVHVTLRRLTEDEAEGLEYRPYVITW